MSIKGSVPEESDNIGAVAGPGAAASGGAVNSALNQARGVAGAGLQIRSDDDPQVAPLPAPAGRIQEPTRQVSTQQELLRQESVTQSLRSALDWEGRAGHRIESASTLQSDLAPLLGKLAAAHTAPAVIAASPKVGDAAPAVGAPALQPVSVEEVDPVLKELDKLIARLDAEARSHARLLCGRRNK